MIYSKFYIVYIYMITALKKNSIMRLYENKFEKIYV